MKNNIKIFMVLLCLSLFLQRGYSLQIDNDSMVVRALLDSNGLQNIPVRLASDMVDGRIYKLELFFYSPFKHISEKVTNITYEIGALTALVMLNLSGNSLTDIPPEIGNLKNLTHLSLYKNSLTRLPNEIGNLSVLQYLWLQDNNLVTVPAEIGNLKSLEYLYLYNNRLKSIPSAIGNLVALKELFLNENNLHNLPSEIGSLINCMVLNVKGNSLKRVPHEIGCMRSIYYLDLSNNDLTTLPGSISKLRPVIYCDLGYNRLDPKTLSDSVIAWANFYDPYWQEKQNMKSDVMTGLYTKPSQFSFIVLNKAIYFNLPGASIVTIKLYNTQGRLITTLLDSYKQKGIYTINWGKDKYGTGIYYLKFSLKDKNIVKKVIVMK